LLAEGQLFRWAKVLAHIAHNMNDDTVPTWAPEYHVESIDEGWCLVWDVFAYDVRRRPKTSAVIRL